MLPTKASAIMAGRCYINILLSHPEIGLHKKSKLIDIKKQTLNEYYLYYTYFFRLPTLPDNLV